MMPMKYKSLDGEKRVIDLDSVIDVVRGMSSKRREWRALIIYSPNENRFLELRDALPDVRGNSPSEEEEVTTSYVQTTFGITATQIAELTTRPGDWVFLER